MKAGYLVFVLLYRFGNACCMLFPQYDRSQGMPGWEQNHLNALAKQYDGIGSAVGQDLVVGVPGHFTVTNAQQLVQRFIHCTRTGAVEYPAGGGGDPMQQILLVHAQNLVGRELMYRIMAKLEPRIDCVDSVSTVINNMDPTVSGSLQNSVNICANFLVNLGLVRNDNIANFVADLKGLSSKVGAVTSAFNGLFNNPVIFASNNVFHIADGATAVNQVGKIQLAAVKGI